jgi:dihydrofolate reductase
VIAAIVVAAAANDVIGRDGTLPWHLPQDLRRFRKLTTGHVVVMGRLTHQSILNRLGHPLADRTSVVISHSPHNPGDHSVLPATSVTAALRLAESLAAAAGDSEFFVAGGESVYRQALPSVDRVYLTRIHNEIAGDRAMPANWLDGFELKRREDATDPASAMAYSWLDYQRAAR